MKKLVLVAALLMCSVSANASVYCVNDALGIGDWFPQYCPGGWRTVSI